LPFADDEVRYRDGLEEVVKDYVGLHAAATNWSLAVPLVEWAAAFNPPGGLDFTECPVHLLHDDERLGPLGPRFLPRLPAIQETKTFVKRLKRLARQFQESWERKKRELQVGPISAKQFEALKGKMSGVYSVRVGSGHRAHLRPVAGYEVWEAIDIGTHTEMGHD
jgi:Txe/YoeB family toxin of Txe-Axe toxin-antitoxin module